MSTDYFTTQVPKTWEDATAEAQEAQAIALIAYRDPKPSAGGFATNMNVVRAELEKEYTEEELLAQFESELTNVGAELQGEPEKVTVGGEDGYRFTSTYGDLSIYQTQVSLDGYSYVVTVTSEKEATAEETMNMVVDSWQWTL